MEKTQKSAELIHNENRILSTANGNPNLNCGKTS